jgi:hypothetical protein
MPTNVDHAGGHATAEAPNAQPTFVGRLGLVLLVLAVLFALFVLFAGLSHPAVFV